MGTFGIVFWPMVILSAISVYCVDLNRVVLCNDILHILYNLGSLHVS